MPSSSRARTSSAPAAQIAQRANLTERSFYRWFQDKREVLFAGDDLEKVLLKAIDAVPAGTGALGS